MKTEIVILFFIAAQALCSAQSCIAASHDCQESYYAPEDFNREHPLSKPHPELLRSMVGAKAGNAIEQRNVAVSYEVGYLVGSCPEMALYWYRKAAKNGDAISQGWIAHNKKFKEMLEGPEFAIRAAPAKLLPLAAPILAAVPAAAQASAAPHNSKPEADSLIEEYDKYRQKLTDPASDYGKLINAGQLLGDILNKAIAK